MTPPLEHVLETSLYVEDLDNSREFYARVLGLKEIFHDARMCAMQIPRAGVLLLFKHGGSLQPSLTPGGTVPPHGGSGALHLCFAIQADALEDWARHLSTMEVALESRVKWKAGATSLYFRDPDGHSLEVATPGLWPNY
jgi:catechol 2,3-dioxygenase-like lactoylglutathione lyase family enzyme